jgi:hypothetical protein
MIYFLRIKACAIALLGECGWLYHGFGTGIEDGVNADDGAA